MKKVIEKLIKKLESLPDGTVTTTKRLLEELGYHYNFPLDIHYALLEAAQEKGIILDMSDHESGEERVPFDMGFTIRHEILSPVGLFSKYIELIFADDLLWDQFQTYVRDCRPYRGEEYFEYHRDQACIGIWREMLDNMGGGFPLTLFASAAFLILAYKEMGHDLDAELEKVKKSRINK